jgi:hypothetical protein
MNEADLLGILRQAVQLQELVLDSYLGSHKSFFQALVVKPHHESSDSTLEEIAQPILPQLQVFKFFLEYASDVPPTTFDEEDFLAMMASRSEVARAVVNGLADEPELESNRQAGGGELAKEENEEEKDTATGDGPGALISSTTAGFNPTTAETTPLPAKPVVRLNVPPISKLITPIQQVEISTNAEDSTGFKQLEKFDRAVEKYNKTNGIPEQDSSRFSFLLEFSNPSDWALQDSEPQWF